MTTRLFALAVGLAFLVVPIVAEAHYSHHYRHHRHYSGYNPSGGPGPAPASMHYPRKNETVPQPQN